MNSLADRFTSQLARLAPFGKRIDDPLNSLKSATRWVQSLPVGDPLKCQQAIANQLKRFNENSTLCAKDRLAALMLLDEKSRDLQDSLVRQYLRNPRMSRAQESQLWHSVHNLYREIADGYQAFVQPGAREASKHQHADLIPLVTLRAIRALGLLLKWRAVRYLPAGETLWLRLHELFRVAERDGFHRQCQRTYAEDGADCSCETAYLHTMMFTLASTGTLYPRQLDLLDRWLCGWHEMLKLDKEYVPDVHSFAVDLSADHAPRRIRKPDSDKPLRFWETAALQQKLHEIQAGLQQGLSPLQLGLTENARSAESLELIEYLQRQWSALATREQRRAPREPTKRLVEVIHGLDAIVAHIKSAGIPADSSPYGPALSYDEANDVRVYGFVTDRTRNRAAAPTAPSPEAERWVMHDESGNGYGALVESRDKDWLRPGALIAVRPQGTSAPWRIGIVRRLSRIDDDTSSVGIETLAETPTLALLHDTTSSGYTVNGVDHSTARGHASLWLATSDAGAASLMIDPVHFIPGKVFQVDGAPEHESIALGRPIEHSEGWLHVAVEPVTR